MPEPLYSFTFRRSAALEAFPQVGTHDLVLAVLAGVPAEPRYEGCLVFEGEAPEEPEAMVCLGLSGAGADSLQEHLVAAMERFGIAVEAVYEGGPPVRTAIARATAGRWTRPSP